MPSFIKPKRIELLSVFKGTLWYPCKLDGEYFLGPDEQMAFLALFSEGHVNSGGRPVRWIRIRHDLDEYEPMFNLDDKIFYIEYEGKAVPFAYGSHTARLYVAGEIDFEVVAATRYVDLVVAGRRFPELSLERSRYFLEQGVTLFLGQDSREIVRLLLAADSYEIEASENQEGDSA